MSVKISFMDYMKLDNSNVKEFKLVHIFLLFFSFHYRCQLVKGQFWQKYGGLQPRQPPWFLQDCYQVNTAILGNKSVLKIVNIGSPNINN